MNDAPQASRSRWPLGIAVALAVFVVVQLAFARIALSEPDPVVPSYASERR